MHKGDGSDHYTFLGNCPPTPFPKLTLTLTSHLGQNVALGEGVGGQFPLESAESTRIESKAPAVRKENNDIH